MVRGLLILVCCAGILAAGAEVLLPPMVSEFMVQGFSRQIPSEKLQVEALSHPAIAMLAGHFDQVTLDAKGAKAGNLTIAEIHARLADVSVDTGEIFSSRKIVLQSIGKGTLSAVVTEADLADYLNHAVKGIKNAAVTIHPEGVTISSHFLLGGLADVAVTLEGKLVVEGKNVKFVTQKVRLGNNPIGSFGTNLMGEIPLLDVSRLPFPVQVKAVTQEPGKIILQAE